MRIASQGIKLIKYNKVKTCKQCGKEKPLTAFGKDKSCKDGYRSKCKECKSQRYTKICEMCGKKFKTGDKIVKYCSQECRDKMVKNIITFNCEVCGKETTKSKFHYDRAKHHYCSPECQRIGNRKRIKCKCDYCGKDIEVTESDYNKYDKHYCNKNCQLKSQENTVTFKCEICGKELISSKSKYNLSEHHYCSLKCRDIGRGLYYSGENSNSWNPNLTEEERVRGRKIEGYNEFVKKVFIRDNYTCQCCGKRSGDKVAHHLNAYHWDKENRLNIDNAVTLCEDCHKEFHKQYGYKNNTKEQFEQFNNKSIKSA